MDKNAIGGVVRAVLAAAGGYFAGKGYIDNETANTIAGALTTIFIAGWSVQSKRAK